MQKRIRTNPKGFNELEKLIEPFEATGRTDSAAFVIWFLQTVVRLDDVEAVDAVCDNSLDAGFDAVHVNDDLKEILVIQGKKAESPKSTQGDTDLKKFVGALIQLKDKASVEKLVNSGLISKELERIIKSEHIAEKVDQGYSIVPIFLTNLAADRVGKLYTATAMAPGGEVLQLWDLPKLTPLIDQINAIVWSIPDTHRIKFKKNEIFVRDPKNDIEFAYAAVPAIELVNLPGIEDTRLFSQNVRLGLGNTRVNRELTSAITKKSEHPGFIKFHNGLTIVAKTAKVWGDHITISGFSVCNGCQSLLALRHNKNKITPELDVLVRIVKVGNDRTLSQEIAYRTNNQNPISLRDLDSNDWIQVQIQEDFHSKYGKFAYYRVKRGEAVADETLDVLDNERAGQLILSMYVREPWSTHQKYRIFGNLSSRIFRYGLLPEQIRLVQLLASIIDSTLMRISHERIRKYALTKFIVLHIVGEMLRDDVEGQQLVENPGPYLDGSNKKGVDQETLLQSLTKIAINAVIELNYYVGQNGGSEYDYKTHFKSRTRMEDLAASAVRSYQQDKARGKATEFALPV